MTPDSSQANFPQLRFREGVGSAHTSTCLQKSINLEINIMIRTIAFIIAALTTVALACPGAPPSSSNVPGTAAMTSPDHGHSPAEHAADANGKVHVADDGTKFDPPVSKTKIPDEAWACVMGGKVHYASMKKGSGECPLCGMELKQHAAHQK